MAAMLCGALTLSGAEYASAAENAAEDLSVEEFSLDDKTLIESAGAKDPELKTGYEGILWLLRIAETNAKNI